MIAGPWARTRALLARGRRVALVALAVVSGLWGAAPPAQAQALDTVVFAKAAPWGIVDAQIAFAIELGFFREERIDPQFVVVGGTYAAAQQILSGAAQTGYLGTEQLPMALQPGATPLPLRMTYNVLRTPIGELVVPAASPVQKLSDLRGKTIGVMSLTTAQVALTKAAMGSVGVQASEYTLLPIGLGAQSVQAVKSGQVDALNLFHTVHEQIIEAGVPLRRLPLPPAFEDFASTGLAFSEAYLRAKPDVVARYGRAMSEGAVACRANPSGCIRALWRVGPASKPAGDEAAALASSLRILEVNFKRLYFFRDGRERFGAYDPEDWPKLLEALRMGGLITTTQVPLDKVYTNQFVADYNKFDRAAVEAAARAYR